MLAELGRAIVIFVSTNVDDILLLAALFAAHLKARAIVAGQFIGMGVLTAASVAAAYAAAGVPAELIRWLGVVPLAMGLYLLVQLWRHRGQSGEDDDDDLQAERRIEGRLHSQVLAVAAVTLANGGDNLSVYIPVFANDLDTVPLYAVTFAVLTALWCWLGHAFVRHPSGGALMRRYGNIILPVVLIAIGVEIILW
jgi:cadmium resistance protein CadD (predicted permease)